MGADNRREFQSMLEEAKIPKAEILKIVDELMNLVDAGKSRMEIDKIISEISVNADFKSLFLENPQKAIRQLK